MTDFTKSQKIKISLTVIWVIISGLLATLFAAIVSQEASSFNFVAFLGTFTLCNLLPLFYWLGFWIWGDGYIFKAISWPFRKNTYQKIERQEASIGRKIFAGFLAVLAFGLIAGLINFAEEAPKYIFLSFSERALRNVEALAMIMVFIISVMAAGKTYRFVIGTKTEPAESKEKLPEIKFSEEHKVMSLIISVTSIVLALAVVFIASNEQRISAAYLFGETGGAFILLGVLTILFTPKKWMKAYQTPVLSVVFLAASILIGYPQYIEAKDARYAAISMADAIEKDFISAATAENTDDIKISSMEVQESNEMAPLVKFVSQSREKAAAIFIDYTNSFPADYENTLTPETLSNINSIRQAKENFQQVLNSIPNYISRAESHFQNLEYEIQNLDIKENYKASVIKGLQKNKDSSLADYYEYFSIQEGMLRDFLAVLTLMESIHGTYEFDEDGQVYFTEDQHIGEYNNLMASIKNYVLLEEEWSDRVQAKALLAAKEMRENYSE
jgi:uncharacterized integral membrane protein